MGKIWHRQKMFMALTTKFCFVDFYISRSFGIWKKNWENFALVQRTKFLKNLLAQFSSKKLCQIGRQTTRGTTTTFNHSCTSHLTDIPYEIPKCFKLFYYQMKNVPVCILRQLRPKTFFSRSQQSSFLFPFHRFSCSLLRLYSFFNLISKIIPSKNVIPS